MRARNDKAIQLLGQIQSGAVPNPPMWASVGFRLISVEPGEIKAQAQAADAHANAFGHVHGGFSATVLDTVLGLSIYTTLGADDQHVTVDLAIKLVGRVPPDEPVYASSSLVQMTRQLGVSEARLCDLDNNVLVHGTTTCLIRRA